MVESGANFTLVDLHSACAILGIAILGIAKSSGISSSYLIYLADSRATVRLCQQV